MDWEVRGNATGYNMNGAEAPTTLRVQAGRKDHRQFADYQRLVPLRCCRQAPTRDGWLHIRSIAAESVNSVSSNVVPKLIERERQSQTITKIRRHEWGIMAAIQPWEVF